MTPSRPYLIRAIYDWIVDNQMTPQLLVNAEVAGVEVPDAYVNDGRIILNVAAGAVRGLSLGNERVEFSARFGGTPFDVTLPTQAVMAVYARENGVGMAFQDNDAGPTPTEPTDDPPTKPKLRVVK